MKNRLNAKVPELKQILGSSRIQEIVAAEVFPNTWREKNVNCALENSNIRVVIRDIFHVICPDPDIRWLPL